MTLDISPLTSAIQRLDEGMTRYLRDTTDTQIRDGLIQRFEFTYELSHKMLKRYLESASPTPGEFDAADFPYLIRSANEQGLLLGDWPKWRQYRDMRAKTSHTYDETSPWLSWQVFRHFSRKRTTSTIRSRPGWPDANA